MMPSVRNTFQGLVFAAIFSASLPAAAQSFAVPPELWDRPRSAKVVMDTPAVRDAVRAYLSQSAARLVIRHARGPESLLLAEELRAWLVALAIESARISFDAGATTADRLTLEVIP